MPYESRGPGDVLTKLYHSAAWQRCREQRLDMDGHRCVVCGTPTRSVHHKPPGARELIRLGLDPCEPAYCESLCRSCHGAADTKRKPKPPNRFMTTVMRKA